MNLLLMNIRMRSLQKQSVLVAQVFFELGWIDGHFPDITSYFHFLLKVKIVQVIEIIGYTIRV